VHVESIKPIATTSGAQKKRKKTSHSDHPMLTLQMFLTVWRGRYFCPAVCALSRNFLTMI
jgi:hypothetical protein